MCLAQGLQCSDAGEARTRGPSVSSQALYHCAPSMCNVNLLCTFNFQMVLMFLIIDTQHTFLLLPFLFFLLPLPSSFSHTQFSLVLPWWPLMPLPPVVFPQPLGLSFQLPLQNITLKF